MARLRDGQKHGWGARLGRIGFLTAGLLTILYLWNPQKIDLFPKDAPQGPRVTPEEVGLFAGKRVAVVIAHPDDAEFYISGTLLRLKASGAKLLFVLATDGGKAYYPPFTTDVEANRRVRRQEQLDSAAQYGAEVVFLDAPDGRYVPDATEQGKLLWALQAFDPQIVLAFDGEYPPRVQHRDHRNSGIATEAVVRRTGAEWLLRFSTHAPNLYVDTSAEWPERERLLAIHRSQFTPDKMPMIANMVRGMSETDGERAGTELAEGFRATRLR